MEFVGKNVEPGILPGNVRATITINLCGKLMCFIIFVRTTLSSVHGIDS